MRVADRTSLFICLALALTIPAHAQSDAEQALAGSIGFATTIYTAKHANTMDPNNPSATAVAVRGDRIVAAGSLDSVKKALGSNPYQSILLSTNAL
jgi:hypothetical protein